MMYLRPERHVFKTVISRAHIAVELLHGTSAETEGAICRNVVTGEAAVDDARTSGARDVRDSRDAGAVVATRRAATEGYNTSTT